MANIEQERFKRECEAVKDLGDQIGYGNMMDIASALWAKEIKDCYGADIADAAFYATTRTNMKTGELTDKTVAHREDLIMLLGVWGI